MARTDSLALVWNQFGPYHMDRCEALGGRLKERITVYGVEIAPASDEYAWAVTGGGAHFTKVTLFPGRKFEQTYAVSRWWKLLNACWSRKVQAVFVSNYNRPEIFFLAVAIELLLRQVYLLAVSKFDDKPRQAWRELGKVALLLPYSGAVAVGPRAADYLRFLGFRRRPVVIGSNTVSLERVKAAAGNVKAPEFAARHFALVARFVPKKDIGTAISAYSRYRNLAGSRARAFHICGSGPLEPEIRAQIADLGLEGIVLHGFVQREGIARVLSGAICLVIPSIEEQWGLVVNEALAFSLPILATDQVGARDLLIRTGVNGYVYEAGNVEGLARLMVSVSQEEVEWRRLTEGSRKIRYEADVARFADAVERLIERGG